MFPELRFSESEIRRMIDSATPEAVLNSLAKEKRNYFDLLNLISPAAMECLPQMREVSRKCRLRYYGKTVTIYAPLYISNSCVNGCKYCDFNIRHKYERKSLTLDEIRQEADAILAMGIDSLLIVAGEDPVRMSVDYLCEVGRMLKEKFSYLSLEIAPQEEEGYRRLFEAGYEGLTLFQETYNQELYKELHPVGPKRVYDFRVWSQLRAGRAGMRNLGMAFLLGLDEWRYLNYHDDWGACTVVFHELGHVLGYNHSSSFTSGPWTQQLMSNFYLDHREKLPVESTKYLDSKNNPNLYYN